MKIWKTVSGVLSLAISAFVVYQSFFAGLVDTLTGNGQASGTAGVVVAVTLAAGGIVSIATRNGSRAGDIAMAVLYGVGGVVGLVLAGNYTDLRIWAVWGLLCMVAAMVDIGMSEMSREEEEEEAVPAAPIPVPVRRGPATLQEVITEQDPRKRNAAIDALPERQAKSYLKQVLNTFLDRRDEDDGSDSLVRILIVVLAVVGLALVVVVAIGIFGSLGLGQGRGSAVTPPPAATRNVQESQPVQDTPEPSQEAQPVTRPIPGSGTLGDSYVEIKDAFLTTDYQGDPAVVVTYAWTNNSQETANAMSELVEQMFQNGVELGMATITSSQRYTPGSSLRDVRPGAQTEVQCAFHLENTTSPVEFEVSGFMDRSGTVVYKSFDLAALEAEI